MTAHPSATDIASAALHSIERSERRFKALVAGAALVEGACLAGYLFLMKFDDRLHWLVLIAAGLVYITLSIGLIASGVRADANTQRLLKAIELLHERLDQRAN